MKNKKPKIKPTAQEILNVLDGMWVDKNGIKLIACCGDNVAWNHMKAIKSIVKDKYDKNCPKSLVPTEEVIDYFNINLNYLRKVAKL